ncbi:DNA recombination protein RmuC [Neptunomonas sp. XY-337]|uniref:DNA recombination protein RmuC n=1 Tax=Neptunomonas sp. XY-337 TaxID=2561897 RepID=UPI001F115A94|nr:DNA recombination protein RmuC [Neptunomonas sp. XY-337]
MFNSGSQESWVLAGVLLLLLVVALLGWWLGSRRHREAYTALQTELHQQALNVAGMEAQLRQLSTLPDELENARYVQTDLREQLAIRQAQVAELEARLHADREATEEKVLLLTQARDQLKQEFQALAAQIFDEKTQRFAESSQREMGMMLNPLREQLGEFKRRVEDVYVREAKDRRALHAEITQLKQLNQQMSEDAVNLTQALKGENKTQGNWGEIILERVLEESGLRKGHEYQVQVSLASEQSRYQPDVIVHLPDGKDVIVDSKVTLTAYERYCSVSSDTERQQHLKAHLISLRGHIKGLGNKAYQKLDGVRSLDFVLMFVPVEGAFLTALEEDPELFRYAFEQNIMLVSPSTLLVTLRTIQNIWRYEHQSRNAQEIAKRGAELHDKFVGFVEALEDVGKHLQRAQGAHDQAYKRLYQGRGNLVQQAVLLNELGINGKKSLPNDLVAAASESTAVDGVDRSEPE